MMCKNATKVYLPENRNVLLTTAVWIFYAFVIAMREIQEDWNIELYFSFLLGFYNYTMMKYT